jgi:hypothetical protein
VGQNPHRKEFVDSGWRIARGDVNLDEDLTDPLISSPLQHLYGGLYYRVLRCPCWELYRRGRSEERRVGKEVSDIV